MEWQQLLSDKRFGSEDETGSAGTRTNFERDYDRIVFSTPFRRLQNKTQVFPLPGTIFVHNRLTHSLEVSCVGRSLGSMVSRTLAGRHPLHFPEGALGSIVSAACLAHDMGNPPFGHSGERAISAYFAEGNGRALEAAVRSEGGRWEDFLHFEGNANTLRLLTHRFHGRNIGGFALTYSTLASIIKYPYSSICNKENYKYGFFSSEEETMHRIAAEVGLVRLAGEAAGYCRHPLVYLVEAADDICYRIMDVEDAYKLRILTLTETQDLFLAFFNDSERKALERRMHTIGDYNEQVALLRAKVINLLAEAAAGAFLDNERDLLCGKPVEPLLQLLPPPVLAAYDLCTETAERKIYPHRDVVDVELAGHQIFGSLIEKMMHALTNPEFSYSRTFLSRVSSQYHIDAATVYDKLQCTLDYISGMTDIFALDLYRKLTGMKLPSA